MPGVGWANQPSFVKLAGNWIFEPDCYSEPCKVRIRNTQTNQCLTIKEYEVDEDNCIAPDEDNYEESQQWEKSETDEHHSFTLYNVIEDSYLCGHDFGMLTIEGMYLPPHFFVYVEL